LSKKTERKPRENIKEAGSLGGGTSSRSRFLKTQRTRHSSGKCRRKVRLKQMESRRPGERERRKRKPTKETREGEGAKLAEETPRKGVGTDPRMEILNGMQLKRTQRRKKKEEHRGRRQVERNRVAERNGKQKKARSTKT